MIFTDFLMTDSGRSHVKHEFSFFLGGFSVVVVHGCKIVMKVFNLMKGRTLKIELVPRLGEIRKGKRKT